MKVLDPATEEVIADIPEMDADAAVARAAAAFPAWRSVAPADRARLLRRFADVIDDARDELAMLESRNTGKPLTDARDEMGMVVDTFAYYAGAPERLLGDTIPVAGGVDLTFREPLGVCALIVPWNFPLTIASWGVAPALAAGNTVVLKPAELTPLTALRLGELARVAGLPAGVLEVVAGAGPVAGRALVEHPDVAKVAFTGSTAVGRDIAARAASTIKRLTLELGGKSANIVFADASLPAAAAAAVPAVFANAGQDCCARSRILVQRSAYDDFLALLAPAVEAFRVGSPADPATRMGPLISAAQRERVRSFEPGVSVLVAGTAPDGPGFWYAPRVVAAAPGDRVATEEVFGPVVAVLPFDDEADAVRIANGTVYGLSGSIWTRDVGRALRMARAVTAGVLSVNSNSSVRVSTPFGGMRQSGVGRELGPHALEAYTDVKNVFIATGE